MGLSGRWVNTSKIRREILTTLVSSGAPYFQYFPTMKWRWTILIKSAMALNSRERPQQAGNGKEGSQWALQQ